MKIIFILCLVLVVVSAQPDEAKPEICLKKIHCVVVNYLIKAVTKAEKDKDKMIMTSAAQEIVAQEIAQEIANFFINTVFKTKFEAYVLQFDIACQAGFKSSKALMVKKLMDETAREVRKSTREVRKSIEKCNEMMAYIDCFRTENEGCEGLLERLHEKDIKNVAVDSLKVAVDSLKGTYEHNRSEYLKKEKAKKDEANVENFLARIEEISTKYGISVVDDIEFQDKIESYVNKLRYALLTYSEYLDDIVDEARFNEKVPTFNELLQKEEEIITYICSQKKKLINDFDEYLAKKETEKEKAKNKKDQAYYEIISYIASKPDHSLKQELRCAFDNFNLHRAKFEEMEFKKQGYIPSGAESHYEEFITYLSNFAETQNKE